MSVWAQRSATAQLVKDKTTELQEQEASFRASFQPSKTETSVDSHGVKTVTEIKLNERGQQIKVVTRVQVKTARVKKSYKAEERRQWRKFGDCAGLEPGEMGANVTFTTTDDVLLERKKQSSEEEKSVDMFSNLSATAVASTAGMMVCRLCGAINDHMFLKCPKRSSMGKEDFEKKINSEGAAPTDDGAPSRPGLLPRPAVSTGKYVPPSHRDGGAAMDPNYRPEQREDFPTIRVTNLSEETEEDDLRDLFGRFGRIARVFLGRDKDTFVSKGYAYIAFFDRAEAQFAITKLNGYGFHSLILRVDWAEKRKPLEGAAGGAATAGGAPGGGFGRR